MERFFDYSCGNLAYLAENHSIEALSERLENGSTLLHLCCVPSTKSEKNDSNRPVSSFIKIDDQNLIKDSKTESPDVLQLCKDKTKERENDTDKIDKEQNKDNLKGKENNKSAKEKDSKEHVRILLEKGADPAIINKNGFSALHLASYKVYSNKLRCRGVCL